MPPITEVLVSDTGTSSSDNITSNAALTGTAAANTVVTIRNGATTLGTVTANNTGVWSYTPTLPDGTYTLTASETTLGPVLQTATLSAPPNMTTAANTYSVNQGNATTATPNTVVTFTEGAVTLGTVTADSSGSWTFGYSRAANQTAAHNFQAHIPTIGNVTQTATLNFTLETVAPVPTIVLATDSGVSSSDHLTNADTLTGTAAGYSTIKLVEGTTTLGTVTANANGTWSFTPTLLDGNHTVTAFEYTPAGHTASETLAFTLDTVAPNVYVALAHDTGTSSTDGITSNPQLTGTADANSVVAISNGVTTLGYTTANASGVWSFTPTLADGSYTVTATDTDAAGNTATDTLNFTLSSTISEALAYDTGVSPTDHITSNPALTGVADANTVVIISNGATTLGSVTADSNGIWSYTPTLSDGNYTLTASRTTLGPVAQTATLAAPPNMTTAANTYSVNQGNATTAVPGSVVTFTEGAATLGTVTADSNGSWTFGYSRAANQTVGHNFQVHISSIGNVVAQSTTLSFTLETVAPIPTIVLATDSGVSSSDHTTNAAAVKGTAAPYSSIVLTEGASTLGTAVTDANGTWSFTPTLADGNHTLTAFESTPAGHTAFETLAFTLDTDAPTVYMALAHDTGTSSSDGITSNPQLTGTADANSAVVISNGGTTLGTVTTNASGAWSFTPTLADGVYTLTASETDLAGNFGTDTLNFTMASTISEALTVDTGISPTDHITSNSALTGVANANAVVTISNGATTLGSVTADANGSWSYTPTIADGSYTLTASETTFGPAFDTATLAAPPNMTTAANTYSVNQGNATIAIPLSVVTFTQGAATLGTVTADSNGSWTFGFSRSANQTAGQNFTAHIPIPGLVAQTATATLSFTLETVAPVPTIVLVTDSGVSPSDHTTNAAAVKGTAAPFSSIVLTEGVTTLGTAIADANGTWGFTPTLADGNHTVTAVETTPAGHTAFETLAFTLDTDAPTVFMALAHDTGSSAIDGITSNPQLTGTADANSVVVISNGATTLGYTLGTATTNASGAWSFTPTLADGIYTLTASETDLAGNTGADTLGFTMQSTISEALAFDTGVSPTDHITSNAALTGVANALAVVTILNGATTLGSVTADANGNWTYTPTIADGSYTLTASESIVVGGTTTTHTATLGFVLETVAPTPTITLVADTGALASDHNTSNPALTGHVAPGSVVTILNGPTTLGSVTADANGTWSYTPTLVDGSYSLTAAEATPAGHNATATLALTLDTTPPVVTVALAHDTGVSAIDGITSNPQLTGTAEANTVVVIRNGATTLGTAATNASGAWSFTPTISDGVYTLTASETDLAGNTGAATLGFTMASTISEALGFDTGVSPTDHITSNAALTGVANALAVVTILNGATTLGSVTADTNGVWTYTPTIPDGSYTLTASESIVVGGTTTAHTATLGFVLETVAPTPTITLVADTGISSSDYNTSNAALTGLVAPGSVVTILNGATTLGSVTANATGTWNYTPTLVDGSYTLTASEATLAGPSASAVIALTLDTTPPVVTVALAHDTGVSAIDHITSNPQLTGTAEANTVVVIRNGATTLGTAATNASGAWSFTPTTLADGAYTLIASETDTAGNTGAATLGFTMASTISEALAVDSGISPTDHITSNAALTGVANALAVVTILNGATTLGSVTADANGIWTYTPTIADGTYTVTASESIVAGTTTTHTATLGFVLETVAPTPTITLVADTGALASDHNTSNPALTGHVAPGSVVTILNGPTTLGSVTADANGTWSYTPTLVDGSYTLTAAEATPAGHGASATLALTLDTTPPVVTVALAHDTGVSAIDGITSNPQLTGTAEANTVVVIRNGSTTLGTAATNASGAWSFTPTISDGVYTLTASETDLAGNTGAATLGFTMASTISEALGFDTGVSPTDHITSNAALTGVANALAVVTILNGATTLGSVTADTNGVWTYTPTIPDGSYTLTASESIVVGGTTTTHTATLGFVLETVAPTPTITLVADTGVLATDHNTSNPALTGHVAPGSVVTILNGPTTLGSVTADATGTWNYTPTLVDGSYTLTAAEATPAGHGASATLALTLDTTAPVVTVALVHDTGVSATDGITSNPQLTGTAEANTVVVIRNGSTTLGTAATNASGAWSFTPTIADGIYTLTASETDIAGNVGTNTLNVTMASTIGEALAVDTGVSPTDHITSNPALTGVANALAVVTILNGATTLGSVTADANGIWTYTPALAGGTYTLTASESIVVGGTTTAHTATLGFVLETVAPTPTITLVADTGVSSTDHNTSNPALTGHVAPGSVVTVLNGAATLGSVTADTNGTWSYTPTLVDGSYTLTAAEATPAGHSASAILALTLDTAPPVVTAALAHDTGVSNIDGITSNPQLTGTAEANTVVVISNNSTTLGYTLGTATANASGAWSFTPTIADGVYTLVASETDTAGNTGASTLGFTMQSTISEALAFDTGVSPTDHITSNAALTGVANALAVVTILNGATTLGSVTADANGNWTYTPTLADASYTLTASESIVVGGTTTTHTATLGFVLETVAPTPAITLVADTGVSSSDHNTSNPALIGYVAPNSVVTVLSGATTLGSVTADASGTWSYTPTLVDGSYTLTAAELTPEGHNATATLALTLDTTPPVVTVALAHDTGISAIDHITSNPQLTGTAEANTVVVVRSGATTLGTAATNASGAWSFTPTISDGVYTLTASETDLAGNTGAATLGFTMASTISEALGFDTGVSPTDHITSNAALTGVANALAVVTILNGATTLGSVTADTNGVWTYTPTIPDGSYTLTASESIVVGGTTTAHTATLGFVLETVAPTPTITLVADTGISSSDYNTSNAALTGLVAPGSVVTILNGATTLGSVTANATGTWNYTPTLVDGSYTLTASEATLAGPSASAVIALTLDTTPPVVTVALAHDTGVSAIDHITSNPQLTGTAEANTVVVIRNGATTLGTAATNASGAWSFTPTTLADGAYTLIASETDTAGNTGAATLGFTMASTISEALAVDSGISPTDHITSNAALTGVANALAVVTILNGATTLGSVTADANGIWTYTPTIADGTYTVTASESIVAGTTTTHTATLGFVLETVAPTPTITLVADTGALASDHNTSNPALTGHVAPGSVVTILNGPTTLGSVTADANGTWSYTPTLVDGSYTLTAAEATPAGHGASATLALTLDTTPPVVTVALAHDTGVSAIDGITSNPQLTGTAEANTVVVIRNGSTTLGTAATNASGAWSFTPTQVDSLYTLTASETDLAGNTGAATLGFTMASTISEALAVDTGVSPTDHITSNAALTGVANALAVVTILNGATTLGSVTADANGIWTYTPTIPDGTYTLTASESIVVGGTTTTHTATLGFVLETVAPTPTITLVADTGVLATDHNTSNPALTGHVAPGSVVTILNGPTTLGSVTADATGTWNYTPTLVDGSYTLTAAEATPAGHGASATLALTLDTTPPVVTVALAHDTGVSAIDGITSNPQLTGTAEANTVVVIRNGSTTLGTAATNASGAWSFTPTIADGIYTLTASEIDLAGNTGAATLGFTMASTISEALAVDTGVSPTDHITSNAALTGVANALAVVTILNGATTLGSVTADANGIWTYTPTIPDGTYTLTASESIVVGGTTTAHTATLGFVLETVAPTPTITLVADTGVSSTDHNTSNPALTGHVAPGSVVTILNGATTLGSVIADATGTWNYTPTLVDGSYALTASDATLAGPSASAILALTLDTTPPTVTMALAHDTGVSAIDGITSNPQLTGTAEANSGVVVRNGSTTLGTAVTNASGAWSFTPTLADGIYTLTASETDLAGNTGTDTLGFTMQSTISESLAVDTGVSPTDHITSNAALTGVANALAVVTILNGATTLGSVTADANGNWTYTPTIADGSYTLTASESIVVGGTTTTHTATLGFVLETVAPAPTAMLVVDTGASATDHDTSNPALTGLVAPGSVVSILNGATTLGSVTADPSGTWSYIPTLVDGSYTLTASEATPAGHSATETLALTLDTTPPVVTFALVHDTGVSTTDSVTSNPQLTGTAEANTVVVVRDGATTLGFATTNAGGAWSFLPTLSAGPHTLTASETDTAGNTGTDTLSFIMISPISEALAVDTGASPTDHITSDAALTGNVAPGTVVSILNSATTLGSVTANASGTWSYTPTLADGSYTLTASEDIPAEYSASATLAFTLDTIPPAKPTLEETVTTTDPAKPTLDGTAPNASTITLYEGGRIVGTALVTAAGTWVYNFDSALAPGGHALTALATDPAGNVSALSNPLNIEVNPDNSYAVVTPSTNAGTTTLRVYDTAGQFTWVDTVNAAGQLLRSVSNTSAVMEIYDNSGKLIGTIAQPSNSATSQPTFSTVGGNLSAVTGSGLVGSNIDLVGESNVVLSQGNDTINAGPGAATVFASGATAWVTGGSGDLVFTSTTGLSTVTGGSGTSTVFGGAGGGWLQGGSAGGNVLVAGGGNTTLLAGGSGDVMAGSAGNTLLTMQAQDTGFGGGGATTMVGGGNDMMVGGSGNTVMVTQGHGVAFGGSGASSIFGSGNDVMVGGSGSNLLVGGKGGGSQMWAGSGSTTMFAGDGGSLIVGGTGNSTAYGGAGNDSFFAIGGGAMSITEGSGNDEVMLGSGLTTISSGSGVDLYDVVAGEAGGASVITGFKVGTDQIRLFGYDLTTAQQNVGSGGMTLTLSDNTRITLVGISNLAPNSIV